MLKNFYLKTNTFYGAKSNACFVLVVLDVIMKELQESTRAKPIKFTIWFLNALLLWNLGKKYTLCKLLNDY